MLSRSIFRYFACTRLLRNSSKSRTSDSTVAWFVVELSGGRVRERRGRGETGAQMPLDKAKVQGKIKTRKSKKEKEWQPNVRAGRLATGPRGDDGKGIQSQK